MHNVLLACTALTLGLFYMIQRDIPPHHATPTPPPTAATAPQTNNNDDRIYTGSIIVVPRGSGDQCWRLTFDNRTGAMRAGRYADCNAITETMENRQKPLLDSDRVQAISAAFTR